MVSQISLGCMLMDSTIDDKNGFLSRKSLIGRQIERKIK
jgi:hypothetical protein